MFGAILALFGLGAVAKQEWNRTSECIDSRAKAKREGRKTYVDGYGSTRWTENAHQLIRSMDDKGYPCWYDIDDHRIIDRFGWENYGKEEYAKQIKIEREREETLKRIERSNEEFNKFMKELDEKKKKEKERVKKLNEKYMEKYGLDYENWRMANNIANRLGMGPKARANYFKQWKEEHM